MADDFEEHFKKNIDILEKNQKKFSEILKSNKKAIIWGFCYISPKYINRYKKKNYTLNLKELELMGSKYSVIDEEGSMTVNEFLELNNHKKPEIQSEDEILNSFLNVILYIDYPHSKIDKDELIYRLALGLSNHEKSSETLNSLINETEGQIFQKDYQEYKRRIGSWH